MINKKNNIKNKRKKIYNISKQILCYIVMTVVMLCATEVYAEHSTEELKSVKSFSEAAEILKDVDPDTYADYTTAQIEKALDDSYDDVSEFKTDFSLYGFGNIRTNVIENIKNTSNTETPEKKEDKTEGETQNGNSKTYDTNYFINNCQNFDKNSGEEAYEALMAWQGKDFFKVKVNGKIQTCSKEEWIKIWPTIYERCKGVLSDIGDSQNFFTFQTEAQNAMTNQLTSNEDSNEDSGGDSSNDSGSDTSQNSGDTSGGDMKLTDIDKQIIYANNGTIVKKGKIIIGIITYICYAIAVAIVIIKGVKFMTAAPEGKAQIKQEMIAVTIGGGILFAASSIIRIIANFVFENIG